MNPDERRAELLAVGEVLVLLERFTEGLKDVLQRYDIDEWWLVRRMHGSRDTHGSRKGFQLDDTLAELRANLARQWLELEREGEEHE